MNPTWERVYIVLYLHFIELHKSPIFERLLAGHTSLSILFILSPFHANHLQKSTVSTRCSTIDMPETYIRFGEFGARVMIEDKEVQHYAMHVDPVKKEVSCWIASEAGKVRQPSFFSFRYSNDTRVHPKQQICFRPFRLNG